jgi:hypothetical protein
MIYGVRTLHYEMPQGREEAKGGGVYLYQNSGKGGWMDGWIEGMKRGRGRVGGGFGDEERRQGGL